jgi:calcineurin-like phosphoesterase family protein
MKFFLISDTHLNHDKIKTYCDRPENFTELILKRWNERVKPDDTVIHLGDVAIGGKSAIEGQVRSLNGRKILIRGNHDRHGSNSWWMDHGFDFSCDSMMFQNWWLTHEPAEKLPWTEGPNCLGNIHGHLHNIWHGFAFASECLVGPEAERLRLELKHSWQRLFAVEYTNYCPIEFDEFTSKPDKYQARRSLKSSG